MAEKTIIAYFMHEEEQREASLMLDNAISTESFVVGVIEEDEIDALKAKGLIVSIIEESRPEPIDELIATHQGIPSRDLDFVDDTGIIARAEHYVAQLAGPLIRDWKIELESTGAKITEAIGANRFSVIVNNEDYSNLSQLGFIQRLTPFSTELLKPQLAPASPVKEAAVGFPEFSIYDIRLRSSDDFSSVKEWLNERNIRIVGSSRRKVRVYLDPESEHSLELGALPGVQRVEEYIMPEIYNNRARNLVGLKSGNGIFHEELTGEGEVIAVADSGIDEDHPDFAGRFRGVVPLARIGDASDLHGHGTHVAGTALGNGAASGGTFKGSAPKAELFFQSIMDRKGRLSGLPLELNELFQEAYDNGARIHNNSWGSNVQSRYTFNSIELDEFARDNLDMTIIVAAGNEGSSEDPINADIGFVDWMSIGAPATSKNALTVGASRSDRLQGGYAQRTFGEVWPQQFPTAPIKDEMTSGDPESLAAFSSRGPCADRRIKPDLVAPGTNIVSTKSSRAPLRNFWGSYAGYSGKYAYMGGTSMAAPLVSGCAALVREFYQKEYAHNASSSLVKATLINGTRWLNGADATATPNDCPNFHQGFGCINMPTTLPNYLEDDLELRYLDSWEDGSLNFNVPGQRYRFELDANGDREIRICLVWADFPANALQNNLNIFAQDLSSRKKYMGNENLPYALRLPDEENNVEIVRLPESGAQSLLIQISAGNILHPNQPFSLVVTGSGLSELRRR